MAINISDITDALVDADYAYNDNENLYTRNNPDGSSYNDVAVDAADNTVTIARYSLKTDAQIGSKQTFDLAKPANLRFILQAI